jgi:CopG family transcriptional regulator/antitoxin EndoAI
MHHKRVTFSLAPEIITILENQAVKNKSHFVADAIVSYARQIEQEELNERLRTGYIYNAELDREIAEEFFPLENEAYDQGRRKE